MVTGNPQRRFNSAGIILHHHDIGIDQISEESYRALFTASENTSPFQSLDWLKIILAIRPDLVLRFIAVVDEQDQNVAFLPYFRMRHIPMTMLSLPYGGYGGFFATIELADAVQRYLKAKVAAKAISLFHLFPNALSPQLRVKLTNTQTTWALRADAPFNMLFSAFGSTLRNSIRRTEKNGLAFGQISSDIDLDDCKNLYRSLVVKHGIAQPYPLELFDHLRKATETGGDIALKVAKYENRVVAFGVFLQSRTQLFYWLGAFSSQHSKLFPTPGILSRAIREACEHSTIRLFNFGAVPSDNESLAWFKQSWNAEPISYISTYSPGYAFLNTMRQGLRLPPRMLRLWHDAKRISPSTSTTV